MVYLGSASQLGGEGPLNTLDYPTIEFDAGRERVTGNPGRKYLSGGRWLELMAEMHDRMPAILPPDVYDVWLDDGIDDADALQSLLVPYPADEMRMVPVSTPNCNWRPG